MSASGSGTPKRDKERCNNRKHYGAKLEYKIS